MAFTLEEIGAYFNNDVKFEIDTEQESLIFGMTDGTEKGMVFIRARENGEVFSLEMEPLNEDQSRFDIPSNHPHVHLALPQLLFANYSTKFGTWEYDPNDGDLKFSIEFPIEDGTITQKQFERILSGVSSAFEYQAQFRHVLETGTLPVQEFKLEQLKTLIDTIVKQVEAQQTPSKEYEDGI